MAWRKLLLTVFSAGLFVSVPVGTSQAAVFTSGCVGWSASQGECSPPEASGEFNNGGVDLSAGIGTGNGGGGDDTGQGGEGDDVGVVIDDNATPGVGGAAPVVRDGFTVNCAPGSPCDPNLVVRMSDLVNIRPVATTFQMEPSGWMVVGLPANFIAGASVHVQSGVLLGFPADVRFTPAGFRWDYGDGTDRTTSSGGSTWASLGLPEFSETATSHTFTAGGEYAISVAAVYTAEYRFAGQSWRGVAGTLAVPAEPIAALAGKAKTVLVDRDCSRSPSGPGC